MEGWSLILTVKMMSWGVFYLISPAINITHKIDFMIRVNNSELVPAIYHFAYPNDNEHLIILDPAIKNTTFTYESNLKPDFKILKGLKTDLNLIHHTNLTEPWVQTQVKKSKFAKHTTNVKTLFYDDYPLNAQVKKDIIEKYLGVEIAPAVIC
nr:hypothetical protein [Abalone asfa-like virus]